MGTQWFLNIEKFIEFFHFISMIVLWQVFETELNNNLLITFCETYSHPDQQKLVKIRHRSEAANLSSIFLKIK